MEEVAAGIPAATDLVDLILSRLLSRGVVGETPSRPDIILP